MRRPQAFTLIEVMVAAVIGFVIVATGSSLAASMVRATRKYEEQAELGARAATTAGYLKSTLSSAAYNWNATQFVSGSATTGSFGVGHCALSTNVCPASKTMLPLEVCSAPTTTATTCPAPTSTTADAVKTLVPRDGTVEAVQIFDRTGTTLPADCSIGTGTISFDVKGVTTSAWSVGDLVLISNGSHANLGRVAGPFATGADASLTRTLVLDIGDGADLALDDGNNGASCSATRSLKRATVMRVKFVVIKHDDTKKELQYAETANSATPLTFQTLVPDVEDFGARFEIARLPGGSSPTGSPRLCTADTSAIFLGGTTLTGACTGERLNGNRSLTTLNRIVGLQLAVVFRSRIATQTFADPVNGVFDRTGVVANDLRLHRRSFFYVGLPNANSL